MERYDTTPVYRVTDHQTEHGSHGHTDIQEPSDSDGMSFSDSSSDRTMSTLQSYEVAEYFRTVHGFTYLNDENLPIFLPIDNLAERLNVVLHTIIRLAYNGVNVPPIVDALLRSGGVDHMATGARVLDVATNSGSWVQEMAETYPTAKFVSVDLKPLAPFVPHQSIEFEVYNFSTGFTYPDASFDFVHARLCVTLTKDFSSLLREMHRVLKPGGILMIAEYPVQPYEVDNPSVHLYSSPRRVAGVKMFRQAWEAQGIDLTPWEDMSSRLEPSHPLWDNHSPSQTAKLEDVPNVVRGFHSVTLHTRLIPSGPWPTDQTQRMIGGLARLLSSNFYTALLPMLMMKGMEQDKAQEIVDGLVEETMDDRFRSYVKSKIWTARRI
ncbi:S-adenosyl-L-methionine-dependent methyltransferase [Ceratobasidium sp. AG-I]|nr:S-adenosyl-L-methionine-dependent methyltransferase [Ceratobasidium sp. AG-I]